MAAPVALKLDEPSEPVMDWEERREHWKRLNTEVGGHPEFSPLTVKAGYIIGVIHDLCESVDQLLRHEKAREVTYLPAYGVFASAVDLLGRCIRGNKRPTDSSKDIKMGFKWLTLQAEDDEAAHLRVSEEQVLIRTTSGAYTINELAALRHFAAHGQAASKAVDAVDYEVLGQLHRPMVDGLERYWSGLQQRESLCNKLAEANVIPLRNWPVLKSWLLMQGDGSGTSITAIFNRFDWRI